MTARGAGRRHRVVITNFAFYPGYKAGGPIKSVAEILDRLDQTVSCLLITSDRDLGDGEPYPGLSGRIIQRGSHEVYYLDRSNARHWMRALRLTRRARPEVLYLNSFWSPMFTVLPVLAALVRLVRPNEILLAPRGELSPGALELKGTKKRAFLLVWSALLRLARTTFHASTDIEARHITAVLPWSHSIVQINSSGPTPRDAPLPPHADARIVFLSRISRKKNLGLALDALTTVPSRVALDIYGPIEDHALWAEYTEVISRMPANVTVRYCGELAPAAVADTLARYDAFAFPTLGENFGHVIAESLAAGCPVICSTETPWGPVLENGGGVVVPTFSTAAWGEALTAWASLPVAQRQSAKERTLVAYRHWREDANDQTAIEALLTAPRPAETTTRASASAHRAER
ncbi:glycosyltransferase [Cellulomonas sp. S1-8]|uniref:glycosyltransferase n=1 Tax=Cellulomonas sp. S1-8 TaxID=2904790 RepID=UPI002244E211|nr:glycosyltransferase [Cellulomonas sp. S1-8]UZN04139.1 glycosyltransferase [Cellulomonas sp. S1-8]